MGEVIDRLHSAMNSHDLDAFVACFAPEYESDQPAHPRRAFRGSDQVRENWTNVFAGVPDFKADLLSSATTDDGVEIGEWRWRGTHVDGSPFAMQGVIVAGVQSSRIMWGRLYMETIELGGGDIDEMVQETYRPPATQ